MHFCRRTLLKSSLYTALAWLCLLPNTLAYPARVVRTPAAAAQPATERHMLLNFRNAEITQVITLMSDVTGKTFVVDNRVRGTVTLVSPKPVSPDEAYQVFLTVLNNKGFTAVPQGAIVKIIPTQQAKENPIPYRD